MPDEIFIVDDEVEVRQLISFHLENAGYHVTLYPDGEACWNDLQHSDSHPDLVLTDVMMPNMNGFHLVENISQADDLPEIPIIMLTGCGTEADVVQGFDTGAHDYITKPFRSQELLARIGRYV